MLDGVQLENTIRPTLFNRNPYLNEMTVEYETSTDDFIDRRLSIAPVRNLKSEGFLYIPELSPKEYNGPDVNFISTLHEWRWPQARFNVLPWARTKGKDKLRKRAAGKFHRLPTKKPEIVVPVTKRPYIDFIRMVPSVPVIKQGDTTGIGLSFQLIDSNSNPHSRQLYRAYINSPKYNFPGYLIKRFFGLKQTLNQMVVGTTDTAGSFGLTWVPPDESQALVVTDTPTATESIQNSERLSFIETPYPVNLDFHGNVIVLNSSGTALSTSASYPITSTYRPSFALDTSRVKLLYPITPGSVVVKKDGKVLTSSTINRLETNQFFVDYENSIINVKGRVDELEITYIPSYYYISQKDPHKIVFYHDKVFANYVGPITVGYDFTITLVVSVNDNAPDSYITESFRLIAQNSLTSKSTKVNTKYLEL